MSAVTSLREVPDGPALGLAILCSGTTSPMLRILQVLQPATAPLWASLTTSQRSKESMRTSQTRSQPNRPALFGLRRRATQHLPLLKAQPSSAAMMLFPTTLFAHRTHLGSPWISRAAVSPRDGRADDV